MTANISEPWAAAAAGICIAARMVPSPARFGTNGLLIEPALRHVNVSTLHPSDCLWCLYPVKELNDWIREFWLHADRRAVRMFEGLSKPDQRRKVQVAQYGDET